MMGWNPIGVHLELIIVQIIIWMLWKIYYIWFFSNCFLKQTANSFDNSIEAGTLLRYSMTTVVVVLKESRICGSCLAIWFRLLDAMAVEVGIYTLWVSIGIKLQLWPIVKEVGVISIDSKIVVRVAIHHRVSAFVVRRLGLRTDHSWSILNWAQDADVARIAVILKALSSIRIVEITKGSWFSLL